MLLLMTAKEAREKSNEVIEIREENILKIIEQSIQAGLKMCCVNFIISEELRDYLRYLGYEVSFSCSQIFGSHYARFTYISWDDN